MCGIFIDQNMVDGNIEIENARFFFKEIDERNNQMITIMHQYTNYVIALLIGMWTVVGTALFSTSILNLNIVSISVPISFRVFILLIAINLSFVLLTYWRLFIHFIDNDIAGNYPRLIYYEKTLLNSSTPQNGEQIPINSIFYNITKKFEGWDAKVQNSNFSWEKKFNFFCYLVDHKKIGSRGQELFDGMTKIAIQIFLFIEVLMIIIYMVSLFGTIDFPIYVLEFIVVVGVFCIKNIKFNNLFEEQITKHKQQNPTEEDICHAISHTMRIQ
jgi:hypothetical protein